MSTKKYIRLTFVKPSFIIAVDDAIKGMKSVGLAACGKFHAALRAAPLGMKAGWLRAYGSLRCRSGRCLTSATGA